MVNPREFVENFLKILKFIKSKNLDMKIDTSFILRPSAGYYCQMPCGNLIITPQGYVTACIEITKKSDPFSELILYGKFDFNKKRFVFNKNNQEKLRKFHFTFYEKCKDCSFKLLCKGGCPMRNLWEGIGAIQKDYTCQMEHLLLPKISQLISKDAAYSDILFQGCKIS